MSSYFDSYVESWSVSRLTHNFKIGWRDIVKLMKKDTVKLMSAAKDYGG
jgi:hypothetical protein